MTTLTNRMTAALDEYGAWQEPLFEDLHRHPELSMLEERTRGHKTCPQPLTPLHSHRNVF